MNRSLCAVLVCAVTSLCALQGTSPIKAAETGGDFVRKDLYPAQVRSIRIYGELLDASHPLTLNYTTISFGATAPKATYYDNAGQNPQVDIDGFSCANSKTHLTLSCSIDVPFDLKACILFLDVPGQDMPDAVHIDCPTELDLVH